MEDKHIRKEHNKSLLLCHFVCPAKYRRDTFQWWVEETLVEICKWIEDRYDMKFEEIGADNDHVYFLIQWVPMESVTVIIRRVKSIIAKKLFERHPEIKKKFWWGQLRTKWYYINIVWMYWGYKTIKNYVKNQWDTKEYKERHKKKANDWYWMVSLFEWVVF